MTAVEDTASASVPITRPEDRHIQKSVSSPEHSLGTLRKMWRGPYFGILLPELVFKSAQLGDDGIPTLVKETTDYIRKKGTEEEGLFRISGSATEIDDMRKEYDRAGTMQLDAVKPSVASVAGLLKQFFRDMPEPLTVGRYYATLIKVSKNPNKDAQLNNLRIIISKIPKAHKDTLQFLLQFLKEISTHSEKTKMTVSNLATVWGPNLIRDTEATDAPKSPQALSQMMEDSENVVAVMQLLIEHVDDVLKPVAHVPGHSRQLSDSEATRNHSV